MPTISWTSVSLVRSGGFGNGAWNGAIMVIGAPDGNTTQASTDDGLTWADTGSELNSASRSMVALDCSGDSMFFRAQPLRSGHIDGSTDGKTWTEFATAPEPSFATVSVDKSSTTFAAVGGGNKVWAQNIQVFESPVDLQATLSNEETVAGATDMRVIRYVGRRWVILCSGGQDVCLSPENEPFDFTVHTVLPFVADWDHMEVSPEGHLLALPFDGNKGALSEDQGETWEEVTLPAGPTWLFVKWVFDRWLVSGEGGLVYQSFDARSWTTVTVPASTSTFYDSAVTTRTRLFVTNSDGFGIYWDHPKGGHRLIGLNTQVPYLFDPRTVRQIKYRVVVTEGQLPVRLRAQNINYAWYTFWGERYFSFRARKGAPPSDVDWDFWEGADLSNSSTTYNPVDIVLTEPGEWFFEIMNDSYTGSPLVEVGSVLGVTLSVEQVPQTLTETLELSDSNSAVAVSTLRERLALTDSATGLANRVATVTEALGLRDSLRVQLSATVTETLELDAVLDGNRIVLASIVDRLRLLDATATERVAVATVIELLALTDVARMVALGEIEDSLLVEDLVESRLTAMATLVVELLLADSVSNGGVFTVVVEESLSLTADLQGLARYLVELRENLEFGLSLTLDGVPYTAFVMNAANKAVSEYDNYDFNSVASFAGRMYGAREDGLYLLEGDDDAGQPIDAFLRTALLRIGNGRASHIDSAYLGYRSNGTLQVKVTYIDGRGEKRGYVYDLQELPADANRNGRVKIGKGLESVYWAFTVSNTDGADFDLDVVNIVPLVMSRRLT